MNTSFFFLLACLSTTSVPCTLVSMVWTGLLDDQLHADGGGEMEDDVVAIDQLGEQRLVDDRVDRVVELRRSALRCVDVVDRAGGEVVEDVDLMAAVEQRFRQMRADEARAAGD